jgi:hypothetical protein
LVTAPVRVTGLSASYSAANEWWALAGGASGIVAIATIANIRTFRTFIFFASIKKL